MAAKTIVKLVFVVIMSIAAFLFVFSGLAVDRKTRKQYKKENRKQDIVVDRRVIKLRMICFLTMLVSLFICVVI